MLKDTTIIDGGLINNKTSKVMEPPASDQVLGQEEERDV